MALIYPRLRREGKTYPLPEAGHEVNINIPERVGSIAAGGYLLISGLKNIGRSPANAVIKTAAAAYLLYRGATGFCPVNKILGRNSNKIENINIKTYFTVNKPRAELYQFWRKLENLPLFMRHLESVQQLDETHSHWKARLPGNVGSISWNAVIVEDKDYFIGWESVGESDIYNAGKVEFRDAPGGRGTEIQAVISYKAPAGAFGTEVAKLMNPLFENIVREDIRNFKQYIEAGEVPPIDGKPYGTRSMKHDINSY